MARSIHVHGTVAFTCGTLARQGDSIVHNHDAEELQRCRQLAEEAAAIMKGVLIGGNDESDHTLDPFWIPANAGDPVPKKITEVVFRKAMRDTVYPGTLLSIEPFKKTSDWWKRVSALHPDYHIVPEDFPNEPERVAKWKRLFDWPCGHARTCIRLFTSDSRNLPTGSLTPRFIPGCSWPAPRRAASSSVWSPVSCGP